ncbi:unnamed protein product [Arctia plantaginis]|uniref:Uncharacterized protein n=1 Tax=Arctia plantaginis TaxID=874455 RepID=A0A8S0ZXT9_ARCPL|nr:unnamed protein product [Arctia plantaginis]
MPLARSPVAENIKLSPKISPKPKIVRPSIGRCEASSDAPPQNRPRGENEAGPSNIEAPDKVSKAATQQKQTTPTGAAQALPKSPKSYPTRTAEAYAKLMKAKYHLNTLKSMKKEVKVVVIEVVDRLYQLVKESEAAVATGKTGKTIKTGPGYAGQDISTAGGSPVETMDNKIILAKLDEHSRLLRETNQKMAELNSNILEQHKEVLTRTNLPTYADVTAVNRGKPRPSTLHSVVVTSEDTAETGEETLDRVQLVSWRWQSAIIPRLLLRRAQHPCR